MPESQDKTQDSAGRFWFLFVDAVATGAASLAPLPVIANSMILKTAAQLPGGVHVFGYLFATMALALIVSRFVSSRLLRVVHAVCAGFYGLMAVSIAIAVAAGDYYAAGSSAHLACITWMHYRAGIEQDPLITQEEDSDG